MMITIILKSHVLLFGVLIIISGIIFPVNSVYGQIKSDQETSLVMNGNDYYFQGLKLLRNIRTNQDINRFDTIRLLDEAIYHFDEAITLISDVPIFYEARGSAFEQRVKQVMAAKENNEIIRLDLLNVNSLDLYWPIIDYQKAIENFNNSGKITMKKGDYSQIFKLYERIYNLTILVHDNWNIATNSASNIDDIKMEFDFDSNFQNMKNLYRNAVILFEQNDYDRAGKKYEEFYHLCVTILQERLNYTTFDEYDLYSIVRYAQELEEEGYGLIKEGDRTQGIEVLKQVAHIYRFMQNMEKYYQIMSYIRTFHLTFQCK